MIFQPNYSTQRREAIKRAQRAVVALASHPDSRAPACRQNGIVNDATAYTDGEAWAAVQALEEAVRAARAAAIELDRVSA